MSLEEADDAHEGIDTFDEFSGHFRTVPSDYGHLHRYHTVLFDFDH